MTEDQNSNENKAEYRPSSGPWELVALSGIIPGAVMAVSRYYLEGIIWLLPTGLAYAFFITNGNFRYNMIQQIIATGIMITIGMYWQDIFEYFKS